TKLAAMQEAAAALGTESDEEAADVADGTGDIEQTEAAERPDAVDVLDDETDVPPVDDAGEAVEEKAEA
ncbi:MAG: hypothetical protein ACRDGK_01585, partial [Actinomycetota bacterium]